MTPTTIIHCKFYHCTLQAQHCVQRQKHTERQPRFGRMLHPPHLQHCSSGKCAQGAKVAASLKSKLIAKVPKITAEYLRGVRQRMRQWAARAEL